MQITSQSQAAPMFEALAINRMEKIMLCESCGKEVTKNAELYQSCGCELDEVSSSNIEISSVESLQKQNEQALDKLTKYEKKFLGSVHYPWRRFFARTVDLVFIGVPVSFLFTFSIIVLFPNNVGGFAKFIENPIGEVVIIYALWLPVEALFLSVGGTTPAKWVFGIRVTRRTGEKLSYGQALQRAFLVFAQGDGLGIPLVTLFTRLFAYRRLKKTGTTLWDTSVDSVVTHRKWGVIRAIVVLLITLTALMIFSILNQINK